MVVPGAGGDRRRVAGVRGLPRLPEHGRGACAHGRSTPARTGTISLLSARRSRIPDGSGGPYGPKRRPIVGRETQRRMAMAVDEAGLPAGRGQSLRPVQQPGERGQHLRVEPPGLDRREPAAWDRTQRHLGCDAGGGRPPRWPLPAEPGLLQRAGGSATGAGGWVGNEISYVYNTTYQQNTFIYAEEGAQVTNIQGDGNTVSQTQIDQDYDVDIDYYDEPPPDYGEEPPLRGGAPARGGASSQRRRRLGSRRRGRRLRAPARGAPTRGAPTRGAPTRGAPARGGRRRRRPLIGEPLTELTGTPGPRPRSLASVFTRVIGPP